MDSASGSDAFEALEPSSELCVRAHQGGARVNSCEPGEVHDGEQEVANLGLQPDGIGIRSEFLRDLLDLLMDLLPGTGRIRPVEADLRDPCLDPVGIRQGIAAVDDVAQDPAAFTGRLALFTRLQRFPWDRLAITKDVGMAPPHLRVERSDDIASREGRPLFGDDDLECDIEKQVTELVAQGIVVATVDGVYDFVCFFEEVSPE